MTIDRTTSLFFDASSLFPAAHSPGGGSAFLITVCAKGYLQAIISSDVLFEAERNLIHKSTAEALTRFRSLIASTPLILVSSPTEPLVLQYEATFFEDAHVVAAALASKAQFLITMDKLLIERVINSNLSIIAILPSEFIASMLPLHPNYADMRK